MFNNSIKAFPAKVDDVCQEWVDALNDPEIVKYSNQRLSKHSLNSQTSFLKKKLVDKSSRIFIFKNDDQMIGIGEISKIDFKNLNAEISYMIINKSFWGKGIGTQIVQKLILVGFNELNLNKLFAGTNSSNIGSQKVLKKNSFQIEGTQKKHLITDNGFEDKIMFGLVRST